MQRIELEPVAIRLRRRFEKELTLLAVRVAITSLQTAQARLQAELVSDPTRATSHRPPETVDAERASDRRGKRTAADLDELARRFTTFVAANPGLRIEQINQALCTSTRELVLPIKKLVAEGDVHTIGNKRGTTYYVRGARAKQH